MATLKELLSELAQDPKRLGEFVHDPEATMEATDFSDEDKRAAAKEDAHAEEPAAAGRGSLIVVGKTAGERITRAQMIDKIGAN